MTKGITKGNNSVVNYLAVGFLLLFVCNAEYNTLIGLPDGSGEVQGYVLNDTRVFLGLPFAKPPLNELRWQPPQPADAWAPEVYDATYNRPHCMQNNSDFGTDYGSEDCLYLNVYAPPARSQPFPTLVFIHGGTYVTGSASEAYFNATRLAAKQQAVVVVANYRLGIFGFFGSEDLRSVSKDGSTGNSGIQDQRFAMQWVQANIKAFGGDPSRVMIFGESAGASSVSVHLAQPNSFGLYHSAVMESGGFTEWAAGPLADAVDVYEHVRESLGCTDSGAAGVKCLMKQDPLDLLRISMSPSLPHPATALRIQWSPVIDGAELMAHPAEVLSQKKIAPGVPVIIGTNLHDGANFVQYTGGESETAFMEWTQVSLGTYVASLLPTVYKVEDYGGYVEMAARLSGDVQFTQPSQNAARYLSTLDPHSSGIGPVYQYFFSHDPSCHTCELPFVFDRLVEEEAQPVTRQMQILAETMGQYWTNFAASGDPNGNGGGNGGDGWEGRVGGSSNNSSTPTTSRRRLPHWPVFKYDAKGVAKNTMLFNTPAAKVVPEPQHQQCAFWVRHWSDVQWAGGVQTGGPFTDKYSFV